MTNLSYEECPFCAVEGGHIPSEKRVSISVEGQDVSFFACKEHAEDIEKRPGLYAVIAAMIKPLSEDAALEQEMLAEC
jgi:hypothetical protein